MLGRRRSRSAVMAVLTAVPAVLLSGCAATGPTVTPAQPSGPPSAAPPLSAGPPEESDLPPGWDERPDGPSPTANTDLDSAALTALLRTRSSAPDDPDRCGPDDVTGRLEGLDVGLGHRYTALTVRNASSRACVVGGVPGLGARGQWGHRFTLTVERGTTSSGHSGPVTLAPGQEAAATLEWTGELAGHDAERASMLVVQLAAGQVPVRVPAELAGVPAGAGDQLDVGMLTTLRISPFEATD